MGIFRRRRSRTESGAVVSDRTAGKADFAALTRFAESREGVEAYIEPVTAVTQATMLLVARDGESMRRRIPSPQEGADFARKKLKIPVYDTNLVGIPQRKRDYDLRRARDASTSRGRGAVRGPSATTSSKVSTPRELAAIMTLETVAAVDPLPDRPSHEDLMRVYRLARKNAHPDRRGGDRTQWDTIEEAARELGLPD